jgi:hypothetical protein
LWSRSVLRSAVADRLPAVGLLVLLDWRSDVLRYNILRYRHDVLRRGILYRRGDIVGDWRWLDVVCHRRWSDILSHYRGRSTNIEVPPSNLCLIMFLFAFQKLRSQQLDWWSLPHCPFRISPSDNIPCSVGPKIQHTVQPTRISLNSFQNYSVDHLLKDWRCFNCLRQYDSIWLSVTAIQSKPNLPNLGIETEEFVVL